MADELGNLLDRVSLDSTDDEVVVHKGDGSTHGQGSTVLYLIGRMVMKKPVNLDAMKSILGKVWQLYNDIDVEEVGERTLDLPVWLEKR